MSNNFQTFQLGAATISFFNVGDGQVKLTEWFSDPQVLNEPRYAAYFAQAARLPTQCIHIALPGISFLVDAGLYNGSPDNHFGIPGYQPPPSLLDGLASIGVQTNAIQQIMITHAHGDHFDGLTVEQAGTLRPTFANAHCFLGAADLAKAETLMSDPNSLESRTFGVLQSAGKLEGVGAVRQLGHGLTIQPSPGETAGHLTLRIHSEGKTLYCIGDLYHHVLEVEQPHLMTPWANAESNMRSRQQLVEAALREDALLIATHIAGVGRLHSTDGGVQWVAG